MSANSFGHLFRITTFGESHGKGIGVVIDGCPSGLVIDYDLIEKDLQRRKPGQSAITTQRKEEEVFQILSGVFENVTTGSPICIFIANKDQRSKDYSHIMDSYRPSHADFVYDKKYKHRDYRGGGRSSARETASRVAAGAIAKMFLAKVGISITGYVSQVGELAMRNAYELSTDYIESNDVRCPDIELADKMIDLIKATKKEGDTVGGVVSCVVRGCPVGIGSPVFDKLHADLAKAMMSINATKGFEIGSGFSSTKMKGSEHNDHFISNADGTISTKTNHSGGIQAGLSNGMDVLFSVAFKPVSTIMQSQESINKEGEKVTIEGKGRHDPCVVPRAVPIVEAMAALVLADQVLRDRAARV